MLAEYFEVDRKKIREESRLFYELRIDESDIKLIGLYAESELGVRVPDHEIADFGIANTGPYGPPSGWVPVTPGAFKGSGGAVHHWIDYIMAHQGSGSR